MSPFEIKQWLLGAITLGSLIAGLFFLRFRRLTHDRLFLFFALAFFVDAVSRLIMAAHVGSSEEHPVIYMLRLVSYGLIVWAIIQKNRKHSQ